MTLDDMKNSVIQLAKQADNNFLELAKRLGELHDVLMSDGTKKNLDEFHNCLKKAKIGKRKGYYLLDIEKTFHGPQFEQIRLIKIGWTKLSILAKYVNIDKPTNLFDMAETHTVEQLNAILAGQLLPIHTVTLKLTDKHYGMLAGVLLANGAVTTSGGSLANKEAALINMCHTLHKAWAAGIN